MRFVFVCLLSVLSAIHLNAQSDTTAPYLKSPKIPAFKIQLTDSSWFSNLNLQAGKPTLILYFSPDCGHCQTETEEILSHMRALDKLQIIMVTSRPFEDMTRFANLYKIDRFPSIKIGRDPDRIITNFYNVRFTPFTALYSANGKLVKVYESDIDINDLINYLKWLC